VVFGEFRDVRHAFWGLFGAFRGPYHPSRAGFRANDIPPYLSNFTVAWMWMPHHTCRPPPVPLLREGRSCCARFSRKLLFRAIFVGYTLRAHFWTRADFHGAFWDIHRLVVGDASRGFWGISGRTARVSGTFRGVSGPVSPVTSRFSGQRHPFLSLQFYRSLDVDAAPYL
jgi:hypothetical protein